MRVTKFQMLKKMTVTAASHLAKGCVAMITRHLKVSVYLNTVVIEHQGPCEVLWNEDGTGTDSIFNRDIWVWVWIWVHDESLK